MASIEIQTFVLGAISDRTVRNTDHNDGVANDLVLVNQFTVLEQDASSPSTPASFPQQDFTFSYPNPCSSSTPDQCSQTTVLSEPVKIVPVSTDKLPMRCSQWPEPSKTDTDIVPSSPLLPSIPATPYAKAKVRHPCSIPAVTSPSSPTVPTTSGSGYLDGIKIPSPLLYHKRSQELLSRSSNEDITAELAKTFLLTCGRDIPEPDFESYKPVDETLLDVSTRSPEQESFLPAALPLMGSGLRQSLSFRNIPRAPWIEESAQHTNDKATASDLSSALATKKNHSPSRSRSDSDTTVIGRQRSSYSNGFPADSTSSTALIFPKLPIPAKLTADAHQARRLGLWEQSAIRHEFVEDDPVTVFKWWTAFEQMLQNGRTSFQGFNSSQPTLGGINGYAVPRRSISTVVKPTAPLQARCTALVPARLYRQDYLGWPKRPCDKPDYQIDNYPILGTFESSGMDTDNVLRVPKWVTELEIKKEDVPKFSNPSDAMGSFDEDFKVSFEDDLQDILGDVIAGEADPPMEASASPLVDVEDEGYFTAQESGSEIGAEEAVQSEDEWAEWDWKQEEQEQGESDGEDHKVGLVGMEWNGAFENWRVLFDSD